MYRISTHLVLIFILTLFSQKVFSQGMTEADISDIKDPNADRDTKKIEKIEVTGSHIKRIDIEGVAPIDTIDQEEFKKVGTIEITDVLKESPAFEAVYEGVGHIRFRGQHAGNVLILLNGMRMPKLDGGYYTTVRNLPASAISRVEMLKDGGSAVYGSDAMSGVMNFITKTDYDGANVGFSSNVSEIGEGTQQSYEGTFGKNFSRGNIMGLVQYENSQSYSEFDVGSFNRDPFVSGQKASNATISGNGSIKTGPKCADGSTCTTDPLVYDQARPDNEDFSTLLSGKYEFNNFDAAVLGLFHRKNTTELGNPQNLRWKDDSGSGGLNTAVNFGNMQPGAYRDEIDSSGVVKDGYINVEGAFVEEFGDYVTEAQEDNYSIQTRVNGWMSDSWSWDVQSGLAITDFERTIVSGEVDQNKLREMFLEGDFVATAAPGEKSDVSEALIQPTYRSRGQMLTSKAVLAGELFNLGDYYESGGMVSMALGAEVQQESFEFDNDQSLVDGTTLTRPTRNFSGKRDVQSAFMEFSIFPVQSVELQLAQRVDSYSDVGDTYNPKFGITYRPIKQVLMRSSVSTGFRAPGITDLYAGDENSLQFFTDQNNCGAECDRGNFDVTTYTTDETKPETSLSYSFGTVIQPVKQVAITVDQWNFEGKDTLSALRASDYTLIESQMGQDGLDQVGATVVRDDATGELESIRIPRVVNMGQRTLRGIDASIDTNFKLSKGINLNVGTNGSFIFERRQKRFAFENEEDRPDTWKNRTYVALSNNNHFARVGMLTVSKQMVGRGDDENTLPQYTEYDFSYGYTASWGGKFNLAIKNLANTRPPVNDTGRLTFAYLQNNYSSFSPLRRRLFLGYNQTF